MTTEQIDAILTSVSQRVEKLVPSGRFYVALYDLKKNELSFPWVREGDNISAWDSRPCKSDNVLPDLVITSAKGLFYENDLLSRFEKDEICYWPDENNIPQSWLGVPMNIGEQVLGALVVESWQKNYSFNKNDEATLATVARQVSIAIDNVRLYEQLDRKIENLRILNDVGRRLASGLVKQENEILDLVIESATKLQLDTRNMYIAFYDPDPNKPDTSEEIYGNLRFALAFEDGQKTSMKDRVARRGLTEYVIRTRQSFNPPDVQQAYRQFAPDSFGRRNPSRTRSWLDVPMLSEGQVFGVIVLRNFEFENSYTEDNREILEILAGQAATALQNLRLYQAEKLAQEQQAATENMAIMGSVAAEFAHKMNNLAGTIPVRVEIAKKLLDGSDPNDTKIMEQLTKIQDEADNILIAAKEIRESSEPRAPEEIDLHKLLEIAISRAENTQQNVQNNIELHRKFAENLPLIYVERNSFLDTLTSIIKNGIEAMDSRGTLTITTSKSRLGRKDAIEIDVSDTGRGMSQEELSKIFKLFYTTKRKGLGFGLWRDRMFIRRLGGELNVQSELGKGSIFTIKIPNKGEN